MILSVIIALIIALFAGVIGYWVGGILEDVMWMTGDSTLPECEKLIGEWKKQCREVNSSYYSGKAIIQSVSSIGTFLVVVLLFLKKFDIF